MIAKNSKEKVIYPELSYRIVGCLFEVFKKLGPNHKEKYYQNSLSLEFQKQNIHFIKELPINLTYKGDKVGMSFIDFLIEDRIVLEIKVGRFFRKTHFEQVLGYLRISNFKLGIIANFKKDGVQFYRVLNA